MAVLGQLVRAGACPPGGPLPALTLQLPVTDALQEVGAERGWTQRHELVVGGIAAARQVVAPQRFLGGGRLEIAQLRGISCSSGQVRQEAVHAVKRHVVALQGGYLQRLAAQGSLWLAASREEAALRRS